MPIRVVRMAALLARPWRVAPSMGVAGLLVLTGAHGLQNAAAEGETRTLSLHHMHTGEDLTITYKRDGRYDDAALQKLNWFMRDWRKEQQTRMDPHVFDVIWEVYREVGAKDPVEVVCGYRSPETNSMLRHRSRNSGVAQFSQHMLGRAVDFYIPGVPLEQIRFAGLRQQRGGVGFYPTSGSPFVHLDTGNVRHWPRMSREQLARVFPDGKTVHIPTDGHPLPRYAQALAEIERRGGSPSATSLAEARSSGAITDGDVGRTTVAANSTRGLLAKLFGFREPDEDSDAEVAADADKSTPPTRAPAVPNAAPVKPQLASVIPIPLMRPKPATQVAEDSDAEVAADADKSTPATRAPAVPSLAPVKPQLASVIPIPLMRPNPATRVALASIPAASAESPSSVVSSRGIWGNGPSSPSESSSAGSSQSAPPAPAVVDRRNGPPAPGAIGSSGHNFVWFSGSQTKLRPAVEDESPPRPPQSIAVPVAAPETTATIGPWKVASSNDRVPPDVALSYAAAPAPALELPRRPAPMGMLGQAEGSSADQRPAPVADKAPPPRQIVSADTRINDPWLRSVVVSPSVHDTMSVSVFGPTDYRALQPLMEKPRSSVAMVFSNDPLFGVVSESFGGAAVAFLPTITFVQSQTARLN